MWRLKGLILLYLFPLFLEPSALSIFFANMLKVPQSTSQSTIFALVGCALYMGNLQSDKLLLEIIPAWFITPLLSFLVVYISGNYLFKQRQKNTTINYIGTRYGNMFKYITLACSCYVAFAIGSNNVANSAGPITSMLFNELDISAGHSGEIVSLLCIIIVAPWFGIGSSFLGRRVLETTGKDIIELGPLSATLVAFITATILLLASTIRGIPVSLVQMNTAAIVAINIIKNGPGGILSKAVILRLFTVWLIAPLIAFVIAYALMAAASFIGLL